MGSLPVELRAAPASPGPPAPSSTSPPRRLLRPRVRRGRQRRQNGAEATGAETEDRVGDRQPTAAELRRILRETQCVGEIARSGKDAAGKPLENEFYYVPERDDSAMRREAVVAGAGRTSLRAVRRNHKVSASD